jgi:anaerobic selenocysteine-containing dehydrogenase
VFADTEVVVEAGDPASTARLSLFPVGVAEEFAELREDAVVAPHFTHRLICARSKYVLNSSGLNLTALRDKMGTTNPALMHPADLEALGFSDDEEIELHSAFGHIPAVLRADARIKRGVIAMHHSWGVAPDSPAAGRVREVGANTNRLVDNRRDQQRYTGMTRQSAIPVFIRRPGAST